MNATDELRRLLDERGVEHTDLGGMTEWANEYRRICRAYTRPEPLTVDVAVFAVPPEQAIAATLGSDATDVLRAIDQLRRDLSGYHGQLVAHNNLQQHCDNQRKRIAELEGLYAKAKTENAKLRELVRDMWPHVRHRSRMCQECELPCNESDECLLYEPMRYRMRELGIEVDG